MGSGFSSGSCDSAHLLVSESLAYAMKADLSSFCLLTVLKASFASLHRHVALMEDGDDDELFCGALNGAALHSPKQLT